MSTKINRVFKTLLIVTAIASCQFFMLAALPNPHIDAANKNLFTVSSDVISQWLDNYSNQGKFIAWAQDTLTQDQVVSFEALVVPEPTPEEKYYAVSRAVAVLQSVKIGTETDAVKELLKELTNLPVPETLLPGGEVDLEATPDAVFNPESPKNEE